MKVVLEGKGKNQKLVIEIPVAVCASKSGKSTVIASTRGNVDTDVIVKGKVMKLGVNAFISAEG